MLLCKHFAIIGVICGNTVFFRICLDLFGIQIAYGNDLAPFRVSFIAAHVDIADTARTDNAYPEFFHFVLLFYGSIV